MLTVLIGCRVAHDHDNLIKMWLPISEKISETTGRHFAINHQQPIGGGCINAAYCINGNGQQYFVKTNAAAGAAMFEAEAAGLEEIAHSRSVRVPKPICHGTTGNTSFLVLEYIELGGSRHGSLAELGCQLARMHRTTSNHYGWRRDNTIGSTPQINTQSDNWVEFWRNRRLRFQLELAARNGYRGSLQRHGERLLSDIEIFFERYTPPASLLHGDLWSGNYDVTRNGEPVIFDPAVYYGDRETDLAMTELFGGFSPQFYQAYENEYPLDNGYSERKILYNLYHVLNHLNLFGGGYLSQAERMMESLLH